MSSSRNRIVRLAVVGAVSLIALGLICRVAGARINTSPSIPLGLYWERDVPAEKGRYVLVCVPHNALFDEALRRDYLGAGFCPGGAGFMMKRIVAVAPDVVSIADDGVRVNRVLLPQSVPLTTDSIGRPMARYRSDAFALSPSRVLLMADARPRSFDGRYFGPLDRSCIESVIVPVWTW